jgi:hypothetical protein
VSHEDWWNQTYPRTSGFVSPPSVRHTKLATNNSDAGKPHCYCEQHTSTVRSSTTYNEQPPRNSTHHNHFDDTHIKQQPHQKVSMSNRHAPQRTRAEEDQIANLRRIEERAWSFYLKLRNFGANRFSERDKSTQITLFVRYNSEVLSIGRETSSLIARLDNLFPILPDFPESRYNAIYQRLRSVRAATNNVMQSFNTLYGSLPSQEKQEVNERLLEEQRREQQLQQRLRTPGPSR